MPVTYIRWMLTKYYSTKLFLLKCMCLTPRNIPQQSDLFLNEVLDKMKCQEIELLVDCHQNSLHSKMHENKKGRHF